MACWAGWLSRLGWLTWLAGLAGWGGLAGLAGLGWVSIRMISFGALGRYLKFGPSSRMLSWLLVGAEIVGQSHLGTSRRSLLIFALRPLRELGAGGKHAPSRLEAGGQVCSTRHSSSERQPGISTRFAAN